MQYFVLKEKSVATLLVSRIKIECRQWHNKISILYLIDSSAFPCCPRTRRNKQSHRRFDSMQVAQRSEEILDLPIEELTALIGADELNVKSEDTVWELVLKWIDYDPQSRKEFIVDLMKNIRLGLLDTQFFLENVKDHPYVTGNEACRPIIIETLKFLYDLEIITQKDGEVPTPKIARPRVPHEILFAIGGWSGRSPTNFIETYDTRADRWVKVGHFIKLK